MARAWGRGLGLSCVLVLACACEPNDVYVGSDLPLTDGGSSRVVVDAARPDATTAGGSGVEVDASRPDAAPLPGRDAATAGAAGAAGDGAGICAPGTADCDGLALNACEADLSTDDANCGRCGNACPTGFGFETNGAHCMAGTCVHECHLLHGDCDDNLANGCETALYANDANCGACGVVCSCSLTGTCQ